MCEIMQNFDFESTLNLPPDELIDSAKNKGLPMSIIGMVVYGALRLFRKRPLNFENVCEYFVIGKNWGGLELGWFFICGSQAAWETKAHEVGHIVQNAGVGGLRTLGLSICSACRYWKRKLFGAKTPYDSWWFEGQATELGLEYLFRKDNYWVYLKDNYWVQGNGK